MRGFDEKLVLDDIKKERVTIMSVVSTTLTRILEQLQGHKLPEYFRCMLLGGGPAALPLLEECVSKGNSSFSNIWDDRNILPNCYLIT